MFKEIDSAIRRVNRVVLRVIFVLISILLVYFDFSTGRFVSFVVFYILCIWLAVVYLGRPYSYLIVLITALGRTYDTYLGYPPGEPIVVAVWQLITNLTTHTLFCYFFFITNQLAVFLKPNSNPLLEKEISHFREIREFVFRPYVNRYWRMAQRLSMIENHYLLAKEYAPFLDLAHNECLELASFDVGNEKLRIIIDRPKWMRREGEIGISFFFGIDRIYTAMFLLSGTPDNIRLIVGNLQGDGRGRADLYKKLTKAMHGMRPHDFLIHTIKMLAAALSCNEIWGISDDAHRSSHWLSRAMKISTYDKIWLEHGGCKDSDSGFFKIPARIDKRTDEETPTRKRALYRRRYQFLDELQSKIGMLISTPQQKTCIKMMHVDYGK